MAIAEKQPVSKCDCVARLMFPFFTLIFLLPSSSSVLANRDRDLAKVWPSRYGQDAFQISSSAAVLVFGRAENECASLTSSVSSSFNAIELLLVHPLLTSERRLIAPISHTFLQPVKSACEFRLPVSIITSFYYQILPVLLSIII